jgi:hypothetical protein
VTSAAYGITVNADRDGSAVKVAATAAQPSAAAGATTAAASPPAATPPAPAPPATTPAKPAPAPPPKPIAPTPSPVQPPPPAPPPAASPPAPAPTPTTPSHHRGSGGTGSDDTHARRSTPRHHSHQPSWLSEGDQPYSGSLFDPYANGVDEHASQAPRAVDGKAKTHWASGDHPDGNLGKQGVGLVVEASGYQSYSALGIQTSTPGFSVEVYSSDASDPPQAGPDQAGSGWKREGSASNTAKQQRIALKGATGNPHYLLVWITKLPQGKARATLSEVSLLP